jgi:hypothetical protein
VSEREERKALEKPGQPPHPACPFYTFSKRVDKFNDLLECAARARGRLEIIPDDKHRAGSAIRDQPSNRRACYLGKWENRAGKPKMGGGERRSVCMSGRERHQFRGDGVTHRGSSKRRQMAPPFFRFVLFSRLGLRRGEDGRPVVCGASRGRESAKERSFFHGCGK